MTGEKLQLFASVWTAPKWMKTNNDYVGIGFLKEEMYQVWANYFVKFFDAYKANGIQFWGVTTQNEPSLAMIPLKQVNSIAWTTRMMGKWISENLGPTLRNSEYSNLKIMCLDDQRFFLPWYVDTVCKYKIVNLSGNGNIYFSFLKTKLPEVMSMALQFIGIGTPSYQLRY